MGDACCKKGGKGPEPQQQATETSKSAYLPDDPSQEPIFPAELKTLQSKELVIKTDRVTWWRPVTLSDAFKLKKAHSNMKIINGNTECCLEVKFRNLVYSHQMTPSAVYELNQINYDADKVSIGSAVTLNKIDASFREWIKSTNSAPKTRIAQAIVEILTWFAGDQIRNVSALGGNLMTASPISDLSQILMASGAWVEYGDGSEIKSAPLDENFFTGYRRTLIPADHLLVRVNIPYCPENAYFKAYKQSKRKEDDIAIVNSAFFVEFDKNSTKVKQFRAAYGGMGPTTRLAVKSNPLMKNQQWTDEVLNKMTDSLAAEFHLPANVPGGFAAYRQCLVTSFFFKFFITVQHELVDAGLIQLNEIVDKSAIGDIEREEMKWIQTHNIVSQDAVGKPIKHRSAAKQVTGEAEYVDDLPKTQNEGYFVPLQSTCANGKIIDVDWEEALKQPGIIGKIDHTDIQGQNDTSGCGLPKGDDEFMRSTHVTSVGQLIGGLVATEEKLARRAIKLVKGLRSLHLSLLTCF